MTQPSSPSSAEVERIRRVYQGYREDPSIHTLWSGSNLGYQAILRERSTQMQKVLQVNVAKALSECRILDIGCGSGGVLADFQRWGAVAENLVGVDLIAERVEAAQHLYPEMQFRLGNAEKLDFATESFDLVILFTVFSSILDLQMSRNVAGEVDRVLNPSGAVVWYDFRYRNPNNPHTRPMRLSDIRQLFPAYQLTLQTVTLLPPVARRLGRLTPVLYPLLAKFPPLRTHHLGLITKPS